MPPSTGPGLRPPWAAVRELFERALALDDAGRAALLAEAAMDPALVAEVRSLLAHEVSGSDEAFLAQPATLAGLAAADAPAADEGDRSGQHLGAWRLVRKVGAGGMGEVWLAERADGSHSGCAAVKLLKRGMDSAAVLQRFAQERQALARLAHPHIARSLDAGASDDGLPYFVMEYVDGRPVHEAALGRPLEQRLKLFLQLADAVAHAHRNLVVHRDLKPGNVLVDAAGQVKLLDFGIAKALDPLESGDGNTTVGGARPYTPHYASREQVRGEPVSTATDIYSLGVLLYQMLTGARPTGRHATTPMGAARGAGRRADAAPPAERQRQPRPALADHARTAGRRPRQHPAQGAGEVGNAALRQRRRAGGRHRRIPRRPPGQCARGQPRLRAGQVRTTQPLGRAGQQRRRAGPGDGAGGHRAARPRGRGAGRGNPGGGLGAGAGAGAARAAGGPGGGARPR